MKKRLRHLKRDVLCNMAFLKSKWMMKRLDDKPIPSNPGEVRLFTMARNEKLRLPYFLKYYFEHGVDRIFFIDNNSSDGTLELALQHENVHVYQTDESFKNYYNWTEHLLRRYGCNHWCVAVDLDEFFIYPHSEKITIPQFAEFLERHQHSAVYCLLLDMYSGSNLKTVSYKIGKDPLYYTPYFDPEYSKEVRLFYDVKFRRKIKTIRFGGGMRKRVFDIDPNCTKVPLFKFNRKISAAAGMHAIEGANVSDIFGVVLHFKYLQDYVGRTFEEANRQQHAGGALLYKKMANKLMKDTTSSFYYKGSVKFKSGDQLTDMGLMASSSDYDRYYKSLVE
jgi:hypothetical protein